MMTKNSVMVQNRPSITKQSARWRLDIHGTILILLLSLHSVLPNQAHGHERRFALEAKASGFWKLIDRNAKMSKVAGGFGFTEGPVWDPSGFLWVSDETLNKLFKVDTRTGAKWEVLSLGDPDGNTYDQEHRLLDCASVLRAIIRLSSDGRTYETVADRYDGRRLNSPNDVVVGPDGAIYFTDPTSDLPADQKQEIPFKGVYRIAQGGEVQLVTKSVEDPNGLAFSPDGKKLYVDDSTRRNIHVFDFNSDGTLHNDRIFGVEPGGSKDGVPDGMRIDHEGNLFVVGPRGIWVWDSQGHHLGTIVVPEQPANLAWGDSDYSTLYVTATTSVYKISTRTHGFVPY